MKTKESWGLLPLTLVALLKSKILCKGSGTKWEENLLKKWKVVL